MTVIVSMLLYVFGLDVSTGKIKTNYGDEVKIDSSGNVIIYDPEYNPTLKPVYYQSPNIIVPNPRNNDIPIVKAVPIVSTNSSYNQIPYGSTSPAYQS